MEIDVSNCTPNDLVKYIDAKYFDAKKKKLSRLSVEWGKWSTQMNKALRARIESLDPKITLCSQLKYVFNYWTVRSQLLELHATKKKIFGKTKRRMLTDELVELKQAINDPHASLGAEANKSFVQIVKEALAE